MFQGTAPAPGELAGVDYLFTDIDDTLTTEGRLLPQTYQALWDLAEAGIRIVPVTGGSAGWCEHIVRAWPVAAAIGESGAFVMKASGNRASFQFWDDEARQRERQQQHLAAILPLLGDRFHLAHDQRLRVADVAIDIVGHDRTEVDALADRIRALGAAVAISSVHINTWRGDYDKQAMSARVLHALGVGDVAGTVGFVGDSRNDGPMFSFVDKSFGVANIAPILDDLPRKPRWITASPAGLGFVEMARALLDARGA
ncbi:HAD-IIB family hydrolase [Devosia sediminis]|uniref:HAD family phosphatase n=1 Tax=Devosia sediminis TaxID=2798801 RepID=A0A934IQM8_9HYPH|nr:HAD-IIB family hydrolase [Devosia sediminis]MBJ3785033.1 HAD family phosphatase [Devosia sediminis]